ncbi:hypothetical protein D3C85_1617920 [compost metagenome]
MNTFDFMEAFDHLGTVNDPLVERFHDNLKRVFMMLKRHDPVHSRIRERDQAVSLAARFLT